MPELRRDPIIGRWVIISTERGKRPHDFVVEPEVTKGGFCPFCQGNEYTTPPEIMAFRSAGTQPNGPGWTLRVMPNKFPALHIYGELGKTGEGIFDKMNGVGAHEVIVETPDRIREQAPQPARILGLGLRHVANARFEVVAAGVHAAHEDVRSIG